MRLLRMDVQYLPSVRPGVDVSPAQKDCIIKPLQKGKIRNMLFMCSVFIPRDCWQSQLEVTSMGYIENENALLSVIDQRAATVSSQLQSTGFLLLARIRSLFRRDVGVLTMPDAVIMRRFCGNPRFFVRNLPRKQRTDVL